MDRRALSRILSLCGGFLIGGVLAFASSYVHASSGVSVAYYWQGLNGPYAQAISSTGQVLGNISPFGSAPTVANAGGGAVSLSQGATINTGLAQGAKSTVKTAVQVATSIPAAKIAKMAVGTVVRGAPAAIVTGLVIEAGLRYAEGIWEKQSGGSSYDVGVCSTAGMPGTIPEASGLSQAACVTYLQSVIPAIWDGSKPYTFQGWSAGTGQWCNKWGCGVSFGQWTKTGTVTNPGQYAQVTEDEAVSALTPVVQGHSDPASIVSAMPGDTLIPDPALPGVTGPAQSVSAPTVSTTTNNVDNRTYTTTTTTTVNNTYNSNTVAQTIINKATTTDDQGNTVAETTEEAQEQAVVVDSELSEVPKLYERKYPDGMTGVWNSKIGEIKATPLFSLPQVFAPNIGGGTCPTWTFNANIGPFMHFGQATISPPCYVWDFIKAVVVIGALMLARALVFGG